MSGRFPVISGQRLIKWLGSLGYQVDRQRGSHVRIERRTALGTHSITIPNHREIARGTLNDILGAVARNVGRDKNDLIRELADF